MLSKSTYFTLSCALAIVLVPTLAACGSSSSASSTSTAATTTQATSTGAEPAALTDAQYIELFAQTKVGTTTTKILSSWPKPYQTYLDQFGHHCYEWYDKPRALYNLCFTVKGVLVAKQIE